MRSDYQTVSGEFGFLFAGDPILKKKEDMWTAYLRPNAKLTVSLGKSVVIQTIVFYNFCSVSDDCTIGVKDISIKLRNEETFSKPLVMIARQLYPCPSEFGNNIRQEIQLKNQTSYKRMNDEVLWKTKHPVRIADLTQTNLPPIRTFGQFVRIRLVDNYGDKNYIGLNGLEIYDSNLSPLLETAKVKFQLAADPVMASAKQTEDDFRVPENLYNGKNDTANRELVWMAPYINRWKLNDPLNMNRLHNQIAIFFERPVDIAAISFWNYTRDPKRGARQAEIFVDECLVCSVREFYPGLHAQLGGRGNRENSLYHFASHRAISRRQAVQPPEAPADQRLAFRVQPRSRARADQSYQHGHHDTGRTERRGA